MSNLRVFIFDGKRAVFHKKAFQHLLTQKAQKEKVAKSKLESQLADKIGVSPDTVHKWNYSGGGPMDIETVKRLATALDISDPSLLLTFTDDGGTTMELLTERQKAAAKRIFDVCVWFLHEFDRTDGFNDYWYEFKNAGSEDPESDIYDMAVSMMSKIHLVLDQEYFDLNGCPIYDELYEYVNEDLYETFNGKLSYAYRFEAIPDGNPTTAEDYLKALTRLNEIIDKYVRADGAGQRQSNGRIAYEIV